MSPRPRPTCSVTADLPSFFGTSSATPNAAAVAALMLQEVPQLTPAQIRQGLDRRRRADERPAGRAHGTTQSGFGLVNAINAINAVDLLASFVDQPGQRRDRHRHSSAITVTFNKAVVFSTIKAADLTFTVDAHRRDRQRRDAGRRRQSTDSRRSSSSRSASPSPPARLANGTYTFSIQSPRRAGRDREDGKDLVPSGKISFTLADVTAPVVTGTSSTAEPFRSSSARHSTPQPSPSQNIFVIRKGTATTWPPSTANYSSYINLNSDPRATISYTTGTNPSTGPADLHGHAQLRRPAPDARCRPTSTRSWSSARHGTSPGVTDLVGNSLDGNFTGAFPSGANGQAQNFVQNLGLQQLSPPRHHHLRA